MELEQLFFHRVSQALAAYQSYAPLHVGCDCGPHFNGAQHHLEALQKAAHKHAKCRGLKAAFPTRRGGRRAVLSGEKVAEIRADTTRTLKQMAADYEVPYKTIVDIRSGKTYRWAQGGS